MSYVFLRLNRTTESQRPLGDVWPRRHTLMVICTTIGNLRERFVKRPKQTSMYDYYGPWRWPRFRSPDGATLRTGGCTKKRTYSRAAVGYVQLIKVKCSFMVRD